MNPEQAKVQQEKLEQLCDRLRHAADFLEQGREGSMRWPGEQLTWCAEAGVFRWFVPEAYGGWNWSERQQLEGYLALSQACLTTAFVLTQWNAACKRLVVSGNSSVRQRWLPGMAEGNVFATVGISHLTTSRQHLHQPVLAAIPAPGGGFLLRGYSPWVTGAAHADVFVVGATLPDEHQILCAIPKRREGVLVSPPNDLVALSASATGEVHFREVMVDEEEVVAGPVTNVMKSGSGGGAGGLQTSTLAIGLATAAISFLQQQAEKRDDLVRATEKLSADVSQLRQQVLRLADGLEGLVSPGQLREQANSLVLRATQATLAASKGAGFVSGHPAGRWCREALFFLVWSCPQPVLAANLCEFAQV